MDKVTEFLKERQAASTPEIAATWSKIEEFYSNKLWHQLTVLIQEFVKSDHFKQGTELLTLYQQFIAEFENKINPLSLVEIICPYVIRQFSEPKEALQFLEKIQEKTKASSEATILCLTAMGNIHLLATEYTATKAIMEKCEALIDELPGVTIVHSRFYELCSNYHQILCNHNDYYKDALRYLGCADMETIPIAEQQERAFNLGLAGLMGDKVFNFGELLQHPILESLKDTQRQWLVDLLFAFNSGNIERMNELEQHWTAQPDLLSNQLKLRQKIMLLCLMEMTFIRPSNSRQIAFDEIAAKTGIPLNEVEILAMKAMSLGLVKGTIDQVEQRVHMTWVQPRVLDKKQVSKMKSKLEIWCNDVSSIDSIISQKANDILT